MASDPDDKRASGQAAAHVRDSLSANAPDDDATKKAVIETATLDASDAKYVMTRLARYMQDPQKEVTLGETNRRTYLSAESSSGRVGGAPPIRRRWSLLLGI